MIDAQKRNISPDDLRAMDPGDLIEFGRAMYQRDVLPRIPHVRKGMMVVLDMVSGDYEIDIRAADAGSRLKKRRPDTVLHIERIGSPTPVSAVSMWRAKDVGDDYGSPKRPPRTDGRRGNLERRRGVSAGRGALGHRF